MMSVDKKNEKVALLVVNKITKSVENLDKKLEAIITEANLSLKEIAKATSDSSKDYSELLENVSITELNLLSLEEDYARKAREADYDLNMKAKENADKVLKDLLKSKDLEAVALGTEMDLNMALKSLRLQLESDVAAVSKNKDNEISRAVGSALSRKELEFKAIIAEKVADIKSYQSQLTSALSQVDDLKEMIAAERMARVEEAQARSGSQVTVNATK